MNKDFITATPDSGSGDATVNVTASKNDGAARSTSVNIAGGGLTRTVTMNQDAGKINFNAGWFFICVKSPGSTPWNDFMGALRFSPGMISVTDITANSGIFPVALSTDVNEMDVSIYCTAPDDESETLAVFSFASAKNANGTPSIIFKRWVRTPDVIVYNGREPNIEFRIDGSNHGFQVANFRQNQYTLLGSVTPGILEYDIIEDDTETAIFTGQMSFTMEYSNT